MEKASPYNMEEIVDFKLKYFLNLRRHSKGENRSINFSVYRNLFSSILQAPALGYNEPIGHS